MSVLPEGNTQSPWGFFTIVIYFIAPKPVGSSEDIGAKKRISVITDSGITASGTGKRWCGSILCNNTWCFQPSVASKSELFWSAHQMSCTLETMSSTQVLRGGGMVINFAVHSLSICLRTVASESSQQITTWMLSGKKFTRSPPSLPSTRSSIPPVSTQWTRLYSALGVGDLVITGIAICLSPGPRQEGSALSTQSLGRSKVCGVVQ